MNCVLLLMWSIHLLGITRSSQDFTMWNVTEYWLDGHNVRRENEQENKKRKIENVEEEGGVEETKGGTENGVHS